MSAATLTRDLVVTHTRALKLPGVAPSLKASRDRPVMRTGRTKTISRRCSARSRPHDTSR
jgi:hypothetical protein